MNVNLSARELQILQGLANGMSRAEVGELLFIAEATVKTHLQRIGQKVGHTRQPALVAYALRRGLIT